MAVTSKTETITPGVAKKYFARNHPNNRTIAEAKVASYVKLIRNDEWQLNGESIKFAEDGTLLDGQHRLKAIMIAGKSIKTLVVRGLPTESVHTMDQGRKRTLASNLQFMGIKSATMKASVLRWLYRFDNGPTFMRSRNPETTEALEQLDLWTPERVAEGCNAVKNVNGIQPHWLHFLRALYIVTDAEVREAGEEVIEARDLFFRKINTGAPMRSEDPVALLREYLRDWSANASNQGRRALHFGRARPMFYAIKAWNDHFEDKTRRIFRMNQGEEWPIPYYLETRTFEKNWTAPGTWNGKDRNGNGSK